MIRNLRSSRRCINVFSARKDQGSNHPVSKANGWIKDFQTQHPTEATAVGGRSSRMIIGLEPLLAVRTFSTYKSSIITQENEKYPSFLTNVDVDVKKKEAWLETLLKTKEKDVNVEAFLFVLKALSSQSANDPGASRRAERWMNRLKQLRKDKQQQPPPECYQAVIEAWANSKREKDDVLVNRSERWLNELIRESETPCANVTPTIECYNAFLNACTRGRGGGNDKRQQVLVRKHAEKADSMLRQIYDQYKQNGNKATVIPNTESFNFVIRGWTRCRKDPSVAQRVLAWVRLMESHQREDPIHSPIRPNTKTYGMLMDAFTSVAKIKATKCLEVDGIWNPDTSRNGMAELREAEAVLSYLEDLYAAGVEGVVPDRAPHNILINGWASLAGLKHHSGPFKAEQTLRKMIKQREDVYYEAGPDSISYEKVMRAWALSGHPNAGKRASWWLKKLWDDYDATGDKNLFPSNRTYNTVIQAFAAADDALSAENILLELGHRFDKTKNPLLRPNSESFSLVIRAWLVRVERHQDIDEQIHSLRRAIEWLISLREVENESDLSTGPELFHGVLKAASYCSDRRPDVLEISKQIFNELKESRHRADSFSYSVLLQVGLNALCSSEDDEVRETFISTLVEECCDEGKVSNAFVRTISNSPTNRYDGWTVEESERTTKKYFGNWPLPVSWTRNVRNKKMLPKPQDTKRTNFELR